MKNGRDIVVLTETRSSKSLLFQILLIIKKNAIVLVIIPTLTIIEGQL